VQGVWVPSWWASPAHPFWGNRPCGEVQFRPQGNCWKITLRVQNAGQTGDPIPMWAVVTGWHDLGRLMGMGTRPCGGYVGRARMRLCGFVWGANRPIMVLILAGRRGWP